MNVQEQVVSPTHAPCQCRARKERFAEYVRLHAPGRLITRENELAVLKVGISDFGLSLDDARGVLFGVANERNIALESEAQRTGRIVVRHMGRGGKITQRQFNETVQIYHGLTNNALPAADAQRHVKQMVADEQVRPRRSWRRLWSRKWYDRI